MGTESLYSFELFVETLSDLRVECYIPSIAFKVLDFPVVNIYCLPRKDIDNLRVKVPIVNTNGLQRLKESDGCFKFRKGKSCLFKMDGNELYAGFGKIPIQLYLFDSWKEPHVLLGTALIPLIQTIDDTFKTNRLKGASGDSPFVFSHRELSDLYNLMGSKIGSLSILWKLTDYGNSIMKHVAHVHNGENSESLDLKVVAAGSGSHFTDKHDNYIAISAEPISSQNKKNVIDTSVLLLDEIGGDGLHKEQDMLYSGSKKIEHLSLPQSYKGDKITSHKCMATKVDPSERLLHNGVIQPPPLFFCASANENKRRQISKLQFEDSSQGRSYVYPKNIETEAVPQIERLSPTKIDGVYRISRSQNPVQDFSCQTNLIDDVKITNTTEQKGDKVSPLLMEMPVLQGLLEDILKFYKHSLVKENMPFTTLGVAQESKKVETKGIVGKKPFGTNCEKRSEKNRKLVSEQRHYQCTNQSPGKLKNRKHSKKPKGTSDNPVDERKPKLHFKLTRTHRLRYAQTHKGDQLNAKTAAIESSYGSKKESTPDRGNELHFSVDSLEERLVAISNYSETSNTYRPAVAMPENTREKMVASTSSKLQDDNDILREKESHRFAEVNTAGLATYTKNLPADLSMATNLQSTFSTITANEVSVDDEHIRTRTIPESITIHSPPSEEHQYLLVSKNNHQPERYFESDLVSSDSMPKVSSKYEGDLDKDESKDNWEDGKRWSDSESDGRDIDNPVPSCFSPSASRSTRRNPRPTGNSDATDNLYGRESSSVWSSHATENYSDNYLSNVKRDSPSPRQIDVEELYSDDFDDACSEGVSQTGSTNM